MPLVLESIAATSLPIDVAGLLPETLAGRMLAEIERLPVQRGNEQVPLAELFRARGSAADLRLEFAGDLTCIHWIGAGMRTGSIRASGSAGRHLGSRMRGGEIEVEGNTSDWLAAELRGGLIRVDGSAGNDAASAYPGSRRGMTGGTLLIHGSAGERLGHSMRRGLVAVAGAVGDFPALDMLAGSILVFGPCGRRPGAGMRRGTLGLFGSQGQGLLPTFRRATRCRPIAIDLVLRELARLKFPVPGELLAGDFELYNGDLATIGRGEILRLAGA